LHSQLRTHHRVFLLTTKYDALGVRKPVECRGGRLTSYGYRVTDNYQRSATYVDTILNGTKPGDLPVEQPVTLEPAVNTETRKALGLTIPKSIPLRADEVIE
jgi:putative ABC transport system substrate-binding protein